MQALTGWVANDSVCVARKPNLFAHILEKTSVNLFYSDLFYFDYWLNNPSLATLLLLLCG